ncbi:hypothetical protein INT46_000272 [Mucor plumbeus]|uniref:DDE-1 domain-containing protein n=1 Tax=Mucor plumbeus TaxID=97098 RepID=A0A8H7V7Y0_9FUNG|nr:hypothetical protein INT46_000272 [Mucor plumbeus]
MAREGIRVRSMNGEAGSVEIHESSIQEQLRKIRDIIQHYELKDIYNMDETGANSVPGVKVDKARLTVCFFCNADASSKLSPIIIGKSEKPRCFNKKSGSDLGFRYYASQKAWMTTPIFRKIIGRFNYEMIKSNRNVVLLLDNAPVHDDKLTFSNVKMVFLPPNSTAHYQPLDAGIIANFKNHYRMTQ